MSRPILISTFSLLALTCSAFCADGPKHWAYVPPQRPPLPAVKDTNWPQNPIDYFILAGIEKARLKPSAPADMATLARRAAFDLTGLPPSLEEVENLSHDNSANVYEQLIERHLASPRYGERMAQHWLDLARYADTHGYLIDAHRDMWRWRDWVIHALNHNMPYDQFTIEQLAGDLLPNATPSQRLASGFNRNHMINYENGAIAEEYRVAYVADRVITTGTVWLGQTLECAQCHDHKYDPFTMQDFYRLFAFFNNVPEEGLDGGRGNASPSMKSPTPQQQQRLDQLREKITALERAMNQRRQSVDSDLAAWENSQQQKLQAPPPVDAFLQVPFDAIEAAKTPVITKLAKLQATFDGSPISVSGKHSPAVLFDGETHATVSSVHLPGPLSTASFAISIFPTTTDRMTIAAVHAPKSKQRIELGMDRGHIELNFSADKRLWKVRSKSTVALRKWQQLAVTFDLGIGTTSVRMYVDGEPIEGTATGESFSDKLEGDTTLYIGGMPEGPGFRGMLDDFHIFLRELTKTEIAAYCGEPLHRALAIPSSQRTPQQTELIREYFLALHDPAFQKLSKQLVTLRNHFSAELQAAPTTMVMSESEKPRKTFVLQGGHFDKPLEEVTAGTPEVLPSFPTNQPRNRLGLATWLVDRSNPLTARVAANRLWQHFFGIGLVRTPDDFGQRGEPPTHPELLDWLAVEFMESGWDVKHLVRLITTSATYRQQSNHRAELMELDPENRLFARAVRLRLDAESIRDMALSLSGLLDSRVGGASVFPYQPDGLWEEVSYNPEEFTAQKYVASHGADLYRRSLYTFWKRTLPPPAMLAFDAPTRERCTVSRTRSNTPLQALVLMNDPTFVEAARKFAERVLAEDCESDEVRAAFAFRLATARHPDSSESAELIQLLEKQRSKFRTNPDSARKLLRVGESPSSPSLDPSELAAWATVANVILSLDEVIVRE